MSAKRTLKKVPFAFLVLLIIAGFVFFAYVPGYVDRDMNTVTLVAKDVREPGYEFLPFVADLHCDMLLWDRDFVAGYDNGHVDLPRMLQANEAFQAFTITSKTPKGINIERNSDDTDQIALLSFAQLRPPSTWFSIKARALHQCRQLHDFAAASDGRFRVITSRGDLSKFIADRASRRNIASGLLGLEGAHCLEADLGNLTVFYDAGVRFIGLAHFFDNEWAGSAHGEKKGGLTKAGRLLVKKMDSLGMIIDLAHSSRKTIDDVLRLTRRPVIVSHTGVRGVCNNQRNLSDKHLLAIGKRKGLVGIGLWETAVCGTDAAATARSMRYVANKIGVDKVALGSDFDGAIHAHFDVTGLPLIMRALRAEGFSSLEVELIMGGNIRDFFLRNLPEK